MNFFDNGRKILDKSRVESRAVNDIKKSIVKSGAGTSLPEVVMGNNDFLAVLRGHAAIISSQEVLLSSQNISIESGHRFASSLGQETQ